MAVGHSNHCDAVNYLAIEALPQDMIGITSTHALPTMAAWGGVDKIVKMNPLAIAMPSAREPANVMEIAFGMTAQRKVRVYQQKVQPIPGDWATDADGALTTDSAAALEGLILPAISGAAATFR